MNPPSESFPKIAIWTWDEQRSQAAVLLASGFTQQATADEVGVSKRTITNWLQHPDFAAEVDRLSLMVDVSSRAERLRITMRVVRQKVKEDAIQTDKDVLDWLKFAQSETDGVKLDLSKLASAFAQDAPPLADSGSDRSTDSEAVN
jgi:ParB-like chromosome segregation protein Spo0J